MFGFFGAAHLDRCGWAKTQAQLERSNPGHFEEFAGGASLNTASIFSGLGGKAKLVTILGEDSPAERVQHIAQDRGIKLLSQTSPKKQTASYTSIVQPNGELVIALADMAIYESFAAAPLLPQLPRTGWFCVDANLPALEIEVLIEAMQCPIIALSVSAAKAQRLSKCLSKIDVLFTNRAEALALTGQKDEAEPRDIIEGLQKLAVRSAVLSNGAKGVWVLDKGKISCLPVPTLATMKDVTGAGDALAGAALFALSNGASLPKAVEFGITAAQKILLVRGPWRDDLKEILKFEGE